MMSPHPTYRYRSSLLLLCLAILYRPSQSHTSKFENIRKFSSDQETHDKADWSDLPLISQITEFWRSLLRRPSHARATLQDPDTVQVLLGEASSGYGVRQDFLSVALGATLFATKERFEAFNTSSKKLQNLASALGPCSLRIGGTSADFMKFDPNAPDDDVSESFDWDDRYDSGFWDPSEIQWARQNFTMSGKEWEAMTSFTKTVGWEILFDFNIFQRHSDGSWDPSNAELLLNYSAQRGISLGAFQLGNEPNSFPHNFNISIPGHQLVKDLLKLKDLLSRYDLYRNLPLVGPDVTSLVRSHTAVAYLIDFLKSGASQAVSSISLHQYYLNGRNTSAQQFMDPTILDHMKTELSVAKAINHHFPPLLDIRMTETSSCFGGGAPGLSDRYVAGFLWLDKLGLCAQYGVRNVYRQTFYGGHYTMIDVDDYSPLPDYFLSVLYKRLVEGPVIDISFSPKRSYLRVYGNCARSSTFYPYPKGAIVIYYLNLRQKSLYLKLSQFRFQQMELFQLTPGDSDGLHSRYVKLNGQTLVMAGSELPQMKPILHIGDVFVPGQSFGFIVVPQANVTWCQTFNDN